LHLGRPSPFLAIFMSVVHASTMDLISTWPDLMSPFVAFVIF
jgi:hypothetical protein